MIAIVLKPVIFKPVESDVGTNPQVILFIFTYVIDLPLVESFTIGKIFEPAVPDTTEAPHGADPEIPPAVFV